VLRFTKGEPSRSAPRKCRLASESMSRTNLDPSDRSLYD
jgi:hypothetical protein